MADITDDFGRVNNFNTADLESLAKSLKSAVGQAVKYMSGQSKDSSDLGKKIEDLADSLEKLGDDVKESIKSTKEFVEKVVRASDDIAKEKEGRKSGLDEVRATQKEQTKVLAAILRSQQKALSDRVAKYTTGGVSLGTVSKKRPALADMGFKPRGTDKVPAMLSPGEFIINRKGTQGNERLLNSINRGYKLGGRVKPSYLSVGGEIPSTKGSKTMEGGEIRMSGRVTTEFKDMEKIFDKAGEDAADSFAERFDKQSREKMARWATGVANLLMGGHSFTQVLFSGSVRDAMEFRVEMRELAFQTQGITGDLRGLQAEFANLGNSIVSETGKSVDILQKVYIKNLRKGFQDNKAGLKVMKSGLFLSTMIGSEAENTADMFGEWYRTLRLSANQMDEMAFNMKDVARSTGMTGDELVGAMRSSEGLLKNLRNQGNLTTSSAKALIEIMAEAKKSGTEETTGRIMDALTGTNKLLGADDQTKNFVYSMAGGMGPEATQKALAGTLMNTREDRAAFADQMMKMFGSYSNGAIKSLEDFDKLSEAERFQMTLKLKAMGLEIDQAKELYNQIKKSSAPMKERLAELDAIANSKFSTEEEKRMALQKKNEMFLSESATNLSKIREKSSSMDISSALNSLEADKEFINRMEQDFPDMYEALTDSMKSQFGLYGSEEQVKSQMKNMDLSKKAELSGLIAAQQVANIAKEKGIEYKDFGPDMAKALERGDSKAFNEAYDSFIAERKKLDTQLEADADPTKALTKSMTELNETIRKYTSSLVGGFIDMIGAMGLLAFQIGFLVTAMHQTFAKGILDNMLSFGMVGSFDDFALKMSDNLGDGVLKKFFNRYLESKTAYNPFANMSGTMGRKSMGGKGTLSSLKDAFKGLGDDVVRGFKTASGASVRFFKTFMAGFNRGWKSSGNFFESMSKGFGYAMKSSDVTRGILMKMGGALKYVNGRYAQAIESLMKVSPALAKFTHSSAMLGKAFMTLRFGEVFTQFGRAMRSGFGLFRSGFASFLSIFKPGGLKGLFGAAKGLVSGGMKGIKAALLGGSLGTAQIIFSAIDMVFGAVSGFMRAGERFSGVLKTMGKTTNDATWGMYASSTVAGALVGILDGLTFGLLSVTGAAEWLNQTLSLVLYTVFSVVEGIVQGIMVPFQMVWSAVKYIGAQFKSIGDSILNVFNSIAGIFGTKAGNWSEAFAMIYPWLKGIGTVIGVIVGGPLMGFLWLVAKGISLALVPIQMLVNAVAGMVQVFAGVIQFIKDIFTVGISKAFWNLGSTIVGAIYGIFKPVVDFVWGLGQDIIAPFKYLYNILVGNSIIPDLVFGIIKFFAMLPIRIMESLLKLPIYLAKALLSLHVYVGDAIMGIGSAILSGMKAVFVEFPKYLWNGLTSLAASDWFGPIFEPFMAILSPLKDAMAELYGAFSEVGSAFSEVGNVLYEVYAAMQEALGSVYEAISSVFSSIYSIFSPITSMFAGTEKSAKSTFGVMDALKGAMWAISKVIGIFLKVALLPLQIIIKGLALVISTVAKVIKGFADILVGLFTLDGARIWKGISGIGEVIWTSVTALPKFLFGVFKKIPTFAFKMFKKIFVEFPVWLLSTLKDGLLALPGVIFSVVKTTFIKLPTYIWDGLKWAFGKLWEWIKSWVPKSVREAAGNVASGYGSNAEQQYDLWDKEGPRTTRALGGIVGGLADIASLDIWQGLKKIAYGAAEGVQAQGQNIWEGVKAVGSYLNPFNYFQEGTRHIEKPGLAMLHQGEMVVPASLVKNISAEGSGKFGRMAQGIAVGAVGGEGVVESGVGMAENVMGVMDEGAIEFLEKNADKIPKIMKQGFEKFGVAGKQVVGTMAKGIGAVGGFISKVGPGLMFAAKGLAKAAPVLAPVLAGISGAFGAKETGRSTMEAGILGAVTGDAKTGSMFSKYLGIKEGSTGDKALGVLGAGAGGAMTGAALGTMVAGPIGTAVGGALGGILGMGGELYKIFTEKKPKPNAEIAEVSPEVAMAKDKMEELMKSTSASIEKTSAVLSTAVGQHAVPVLRPDEESVSDVQPVHLRDITDSILRDRAGSGGNRLQSDELARMEEASYRQVEELEQIREGIKEMVSLLRPKGGSVVGDTSGSGHGRTKDPRRPLHAANFGKMKYGKVGGNANRSLVNNGES